MADRDCTAELDGIGAELAASGAVEVAGVASLRSSGGILEAACGAIVDAEGALAAGFAVGKGAAIVWPRHYFDARGLYRVFNDAVYRFYRSNSAPPEEGDSPFGTNATLPHTPTDTYADGTWYLACSWFNGVLDSGFLPVGPNGERYLRLDLSGGVEVGNPPLGPQDWRLEQVAGGVPRIWAFLADMSADAADQWAIAYTTDGSTPAEDTPDVTQDVEAGGLAVLQYDLPAQASGTVVKVRLQTRRNDGTEGSPSWVYSEGSTVKTLTIDTAGPGRPLGGDRWPGRLPEEGL